MNWTGLIDYHLVEIASFFLPLPLLATAAANNAPAILNGVLLSL